MTNFVSSHDDAISTASSSRSEDKTVTFSNFEFRALPEIQIFLKLQQSCLLSAPLALQPTVDEEGYSIPQRDEEGAEPDDKEEDWGSYDSEEVSRGGRGLAGCQKMFLNLKSGGKSE